MMKFKFLLILLAFTADFLGSIPRASVRWT
jgi:hypothetical protein